MVLNTEAEQQAFAPLVAYDTWIGLHRDPRNRSRWLWVDESNTDYTNWDNSAGGSGDCVYLISYSSKWFDRSCTSSLNYVCEISGK